MHNLLFLADLVIILLAAVLIIMISRPLRIPSIVGFLLTGILIGPSGLNIVGETSIIQAFAEIGVVLLLFVIGLEFSLSLLRSIWRQFLLAGGLQVIVTTGVVIAISGFSKFALGERIFFGFLVALSSTAIVLKLLADRSEIDTPHGKLMIGILLFQDFCMVPMIVLTPLLAGGAGASLERVLLRLGLSVIAVIVIFLFPRNVINAQIQIIRDENYSILRGVPQTAQGLDRVARHLTAGTSDIFLITDDCRAGGETLRELDISERTGASLIAVVRNEKPFITPAADFRIETGDILVLVGNHASMDKAFHYLSKAE
jgi:hypothetical protein